MNGSLDDIEYQVFDRTGRKHWAKGGYVISDGGFVNAGVFIDPDHQRMDRDSVIWSEWVESVRKDVECLFGILKARFRFLRNGIPYHKAPTIEAAF
jgi:hypothetical protein